MVVTNYELQIMISSSIKNMTLSGQNNSHGEQRMEKNERWVEWRKLTCRYLKEITSFWNQNFEFKISNIRKKRKI